jgi:hypothetical protein
VLALEEAGQLAKPRLPKICKNSYYISSFSV